MNEKRDNVSVPPVLLSMLICERIILDQFSSMTSIINVVQVINSPQFPCRHYRIFFFCELTNGHGNVRPVIKLINSADEKVIFQQAGQIAFKDVKQIQNLVLQLNGIVFPHPGEYRFQLFIDDQLIGERRLLCRKVDMPNRQQPPQPPQQP